MVAIVRRPSANHSNGQDTQLLHRMDYVNSPRWYCFSLNSPHESQLRAARATAKLPCCCCPTRKDRYSLLGLSVSTKTPSSPVASLSIPGRIGGFLLSRKLGTRRRIHRNRPRDALETSWPLSTVPHLGSRVNVQSHFPANRYVTVREAVLVLVTICRSIIPPMSPSSLMASSLASVKGRLAPQ